MRKRKRQKTAELMEERLLLQYNKSCTVRQIRGQLHCKLWLAQLFQSLFFREDEPDSYAGKTGSKL
ncbi:hypothetical protein COLO4_12077 [Corchorus olitorius]|uniref:Uncharacterized protein n=1 Tax=Corchorus olitorius TaxID=93759 RepID=A0A1R3K276_9ROSI|nr:hypothetical protein COLO4_12077 [Corchorus olitorius]